MTRMNKDSLYWKTCSCSRRFAGWDISIHQSQTFWHYFNEIQVWNDIKIVYILCQTVWKFILDKICEKVNVVFQRKRKKSVYWISIQYYSHSIVLCYFSLYLTMVKRCQTANWYKCCRQTHATSLCNADRMHSSTTDKRIWGILYRLHTRVCVMCFRMHSSTAHKAAPFTFPHLKTALWDHTPKGKPISLHISAYR